MKWDEGAKRKRAEVLIRGGVRHWEDGRRAMAECEKYIFKEESNIWPDSIHNMCVGHKMGWKDKHWAIDLRGVMRNQTY